MSLDPHDQLPGAIALTLIYNFPEIEATFN